ncbi:PadR family transcriptional regulator [Acidianus ambivalens]|uniref:PadR family transcriptional regulator n=1 Tax=Acidianus ambivalens TaxID=2283 RepID=A0A650CT31_ACIAM|nr:PadR family transcriptional regulator [Acidianus ambivalens]MQL55488.1 PadR family transcriptional regulator [Acidianus ambivalens]QGR21021.1 PadR family transcriptional regulator [Acidianus ambivalens]
MQNNIKFELRTYHVHFHRGRGLRQIILYLLYTNGPLTGAEIMEKVEESSMGMWRPSPGSVYPMIRELEAEGLIEVVKTEGTKKYYGLTNKGKELLGGIPKERRIDNAITELESLVDYILDNWDSLNSEEKDRIRKIIEKLKSVS